MQVSYWNCLVRLMQLLLFDWLVKFVLYCFELHLSTVASK